MKLSVRGTICVVLAALGIVITFYSCRHDAGQLQQVPDDGGYPDAVNRIIMLHCTTGPTGGGCHNAIGAENAGGLRVDTWDNLFNGSNHGAAVIPYDTVNSPLLHYINNDSTLGPVSVPTMPYTGTNY